MQVGAGAACAHAGRVNARLSIVIVVIANITACSSVSVETVSSGSVRQIVKTTRYSTEPKVDYVIVVNADRSERGAALIGDVYRSILTTGRRSAARSGVRWNPVERRAFVVSAETGAVLGPRENVNLMWSEAQATTEGAERFASAVRGALESSASYVARGEGQVAVLDRTLRALEPSSDGTRRQIVLLTTTDDGEAVPERDKGFEERARDDRRARRDVYEEVIVAVPGEGQKGWCKATAPRLEAWAASNRPVTFLPSCDGVSIGPELDDGGGGLSCFDQAVAIERCRVRAFVPKSEGCDPARGWRNALDTRATDPALADKRVCDVAVLEGHDAERCSRQRPLDAHVSGWCLPPPMLPFCAALYPRVVGGAAPPWATIEITCDVQ